MNLRADPNATWKWYGENDPYYGVLADSKFRMTETRAQFFATGEEYVQSLLRMIRQHSDGDLAFDRVLDFGCGVGRVLIPLARISSSAIGVDISPGMLREASTNSTAAGLKNVSLVASLADAGGSYDFIHSSLVFQHMPVRIGLQAILQLCQKLSVRGIMLIQLALGHRKSFSRTVSYWLRCHVPGINPLVNPLFNILRGRPARLPMMQMNVYPINEVLTLVEPYCKFILLDAAPEGEYLSVILIAQRRAAQLGQR